MPFPIAEYAVHVFLPGFGALYVLVPEWTAMRGRLLCRNRSVNCA